MDIVIPVYKPGEHLLNLLLQLQKQTLPFNKIFLINTEQVFFDEKKYLIDDRISVTHISKEEFDHAATRNRGMLMSEADYVMFLTDDAIPADSSLISELVKAMEAIGQNGEKTAVSYGRQIPREDCRFIEKYTRQFNYPLKSKIKTQKDIDSMGIKAFFCSDVCAMYDRAIYISTGGFVDRAIFNEDMIYAYKMLKMGYCIHYCANANVIHSHNYNLKQQFSRNFDMGVSQAEHPEVFAGIKSESEGVRLVKKTAMYLLKNGHWYDVPYLVLSSGAKYLGYRAGRNYKRLSNKKIKRYTLNKTYWNNTDK